MLFLGLNSFAGKSEIQQSILSNDTLKSFVLKQLGIKRTEIKEELLTEKTLPNTTNQSVLVIPKLIGEDEGMFTIDAMILVVNNQTGKILQRFSQENILESDAVAISEFIIDTAPYILSKEVRAFGIRVNYRNTSSVNPFYKTDISLYVQEGNQLKRVFGDYEISVENGERGSDECNSQQRQMNGIIALDSDSAHGYFNLIIKEKISMRIFQVDATGDCKETITEEHERKTVLYYNGTTYNWGLDW